MSVTRRWNAEILFSIILLKSFGMLFAMADPSPPDHHAKLILIDDQNQRYELSGRKCHGGVFITEPRKFKCACVYGVYAFV